MVTSYCVKERRQTQCVYASEKIVTARNGRMMMKCVCASCGATKSRFVKASKGQSGGVGWGDALFHASAQAAKRMLKKGSKQALESDTLRNFAKSKAKKYVGSLINREVDDITQRLADVL